MLLPRLSLLALPLPLMLALASAPAVSQEAPSGDVGPAKVQALPPEVMRSVEEASNNLLQVQEYDVPLDCGASVENTRWSIETMLEVGQRNVDSGHMARSEYEPTAAKLRTVLGSISMQDCETATGTKRAFYACMSSDHNHALACADAHRF